ncbi:PIN domain-like protein [Triangularia setosa]|uniref:PIN domain-like protein n=1 Tax=Triangularia setosa TaxID=2587417 RepID=A0AAN7A4E9_9PEZI|nr:PIN domain-like protein [Podospora setosa]
MGIQGLFPLLKSIHRTTELKKYAGETFGVDGYGWLHRGAIACAIELAQGKPTRKYVDFAMHRVKMFKYFGVTPYLVFDGDFLPSKAKTESSREKRREQSLKTGLELLKAGKPSKAHLELQKAIDVTPEMARHLIEELKKAGVPYIVAPYEADAQLVYLEREGIISGIVSEDSDMLVFGAKRLLTKMDQHGQCVEIQRKDFCLVREISLTGWTDTEFRHMAILSGCDYLDAVNNVGLKTAYRLIRKHKTPERIIQMLKFEGKHRVPENYLEEFKQAELTFLHQRVFCPKKKDIVFFSEPGPALNVDEMPFIGAPVETELARAIAAGDVNPITKKRIVLPSSRTSPPSPGKRRISQTMAPVTAPTRNLGKPPGKPINEYFAKHKRIPLGEMDANCFNNNIQNGQSPGNSPRPIVFPLPRPYIEGVEEPARPSRRYVNREAALGGERRRRSEPVSNLLATYEASSNRRRTTGPIVDIFQDAGPSTSTTRPPKKARLCDDDLPTLTDNSTPVRSKFFSSSKEGADLILSDDSIEDAFRSLCDQEIEMSAPPRIRMAHGLPSPASSTPSTLMSTPYSIMDTPSTTTDTPFAIMDTPSSATDTPSGIMNRSSDIINTPSSSKSGTPSSSRAPILTPLQRLGFQALQRGKPRVISSSIPQGIRSSSCSRRSSSLAVNPASIPLPRADLAEIEALSQPVGSEDLILPSSDGELEQEEEEGPRVSNRGLNLSRFKYT